MGLEYRRSATERARSKAAYILVVLKGDAGLGYQLKFLGNYASTSDQIADDLSELMRRIKYGEG